MDMTPIINILERDDVLQLDNEEKTESENQYPCEIDIDIFSNSDQWELPDDVVERLTEIASTRANNSNENEIWPEEISRGDSGIWDMCAWYKPIHYFAHDWGIYIREDCIINLAKAISSYVDTRALSSLGPQLFAKSVIRAAFQAFYLHEHFHHKVESFGIRLHISQGLPSKYLRYKTNVYRPTLYTDSCLEEALANADSYRRLSEFSRKNPIPYPIMIGAKQYLKNTFKYDPPGYRMAEYYLSQNDFKNGVSLLQCQINEGALATRQSHLDWLSATQMMHSLFNHRSNIYSIVKRGSRPILPSKVFPKPCSTSDMIKIYQNKGFSVVPGGKGSHVKLKNSNGDTMILPGNRKELSVGVLNSALKSLGYSIGDLPNIL